MSRPYDDEQRRRGEHLESCWDGCDDLHDDACVNCGDETCAGCWGDEYEGEPFVVTVPVDRRLL